MKVSELIELLQMEDQDADVHFSYNYGDHWRTQVAPTVDSVEEGVVKYSSYHSMDKIEDDEDELFDEDTGDYKEGVRKVVVLG
jgi:hypothetical protein